jgi:regulator of RNase E activity RraA
MASKFSDPTTFDDVQRILHEQDISTCTISDVLDGLGVPNAVLDGRLQRLSGGTGMFAGICVPVSWVAVRKGQSIMAECPSTWTQVRDFLVPEIVEGAGRVYVAGAGPIVTDAALAGGLSVTYLTEVVGFEGMVLGGAIRDRSAVEQSGLPVVASNFVPTDTQGAFRVDSVGESCIIANVVIRADDWIFSDGNGTVVVPRSQLAEVLRAATEIEIAERAISERLHVGERLPGIIDAVGRI